jgi:ParB-like nuclease domain
MAAKILDPGAGSIGSGMAIARRDRHVLGKVDLDESSLRHIPLVAIKVDSSVQQRVVGTSQEVVEEYALAMRDGDQFPPLIVFSTNGLTYYLCDGFHRLDAYQLAHPDADQIACEVRPGDHDDALLFACGANASHGLPRSNSDKRKAVLALLSSEKWSHWSDREIARQCRVSHPFVSKLRNEYLETLPDEEEVLVAPAAETAPTNVPVMLPSRRRTAIRHGKSYTMKTARTGFTRATSSRLTNVEAKPQLTSLAWSMAPEVERVKFISGVGGREILDTLKSISPGFSLLNWAWKAAGQAERQEFAREHHEAIISLSNPPPPAGHSQNAPTEKRATPPFLERGTPAALDGPGPSAAAERIRGPVRRRRAAGSEP